MVNVDGAKNSAVKLKNSTKPDSRKTQQGDLLINSDNLNPLLPNVSQRERLATILILN